VVGAQLVAHALDVPAPELRRSPRLLYPAVPFARLFLCPAPREFRCAPVANERRVQDERRHPFRIAGREEKAHRSARLESVDDCSLRGCRSITARMSSRLFSIAI